jgi:hypothetical protein
MFTHPDGGSNSKEDSLARAIMNAMNYTGHHQPRETAEMILILLQHGAKPDFVSEKYREPISLLMYAAENNFRDVCLALAEFGADPSKGEVWSRDQSPMQRFGRGSTVFRTLSLPQAEIDECCAEMVRLYDIFATAKRRRENMERRMPVLLLLHKGGYRTLLHKEVNVFVPGAKLPGIARGTPRQNHEYLLVAVFGHRGLANLIVTFV